MKHLHRNVSAPCLSFLFAALLLLSACTKEKLVAVDPEFSKYVEAYTSGTVSKTSDITIRLVPQNILAHGIGETTDKLFSFSPSLTGKTTWADERTITFRPDKQLEPGTLYTVEFNLGKVMKVPAKFSKFRFNVKAMEPSFRVNNFGLKTEGDSRTLMYLTGEVETADYEDSAAVAKLLSATYAGKRPAIVWNHDAAQRRSAFTISSLERGKSAAELSLSWNGSAIGSDLAGSEKIVVPAEGDFKVLRIAAVNEDESYGLVQFSAPIAVTQDLTGLITVEPDIDISYSVIGSEVKLYSESTMEGNFTVTVNPGIENTWGEKLPRGSQAVIGFENRMPSVKMIGEGTILPNSGKVLLPFEAVNLSAVDISVIRIYESNVPQFLQNNQYDGEYQLRRVGKPIAQKTMRLDNDQTLDLSRRTRFTLDLDQLIRTEPGAMYRVTIGFRPSYSLYACNTEEGSGEESGEEAYYYDDYYYDGSDWNDEDDEFWNSYDEYYPYGYDWEERENPCASSYYNKERWDSRTVLSSNIGLTLKRGNDQSVTVIVTDLLTAKPLPNVDLELLDFQQQVIRKMKSDADGLATVDIRQKPFLLIAKRKNERGYLKLDDGSALSMSRFDVSGDEVREGIKGFIFGERGVWRPGDSMYVSFILEDKGDLIPEDHPVEFNLFNPQGMLYRKMVTTKGLNGYYLFATATDPGAPTGNWTAKVKVGGAEFEKRLKIETIMPNRLKIRLNFGKRTRIAVNDEMPVSLSSMWLFGAPAKMLNAKVDAVLTRQPTVFEKYKEYIFDDPSRYFATENKTIFEGKLDANGNTEFLPAFEGVDDAPGMLRANFTVKVFEPGGAFSIDNVSMPYSPYSSYIGIKIPKGQDTYGFLLSGKTYPVSIANVDPDGRPAAVNDTVEVELYKMDWRWWWDNSGDDITNYATERSNKLVKSERLRMSGGAGRYNLSAPDGGWGRYLLIVRDPSSGHSTGKVVYFDDEYWQTRVNTGDNTAATMLSFSADKSKYSIGEKIKIRIPSSKGGRLLVSVENGRKVLHTYWLPAEDGQTLFEFTAEEGMAPNIYVNVSLFQPHAQTINDLPIRMYGVVSVAVEDKNTILKPLLSAPAVIRPEQVTNIGIAEESGREMTYSIAIVDEGLLDLTRFKTPDPYAYFYAKEALGVKTWDMYDQVIGAFGGSLDRILTIGGDEELYAPGKQKGANRFKSVVRFMGPFHLKKGEKRMHSFRLPAYIGSVKIMVVAEQNGSYGNTEKLVAVKNPVMMLTTLPRALGPGEQISIPVTVFATEKSIRNVTVELKNNPFLEVIGGNEKMAVFTGPGEETVYFDAKIRPATGITKISFTATSGNQKAVSETEIDIRNPNPPVTVTTGSMLLAGRQWTITAQPIGMPSSAKAVLELSSMLPINLQKRLGYLIRYPHGCVEQTVSAVFPQLALQQLTDMTESRKREVDKNINAAIRRIKNFQASDGGFTYWPGTGKSDDWGTNYAGHFLLEAQSRGYAVPDDLLQSWIRYERKKADQWSPSYETLRYYGYDLTQSYRLYLLALAKSPDVGAMNRLKEFQYISQEAKWRLAAAYQVAGYPQVASGLISGLSTIPPEPSAPGFTFGSSLRDQAMILETLTLMKRQKQAVGVLESISARLASEEWMSTQTTAFCLVAISKFNGSNASGKKIEATVRINGVSTPVSSANYTTQLPVDVSKGNVNLSVSNNGQGMLYARLITEGQPLPGEKVEQKQDANLRLKIEYLDYDGKLIDASRLSQGTDFAARVTVTNPGTRGNYMEMAFSQVFPAGWEIINTRVFEGDNLFTSSPYEYQDIRDDRVYTYFDLNEKTSKTYYVLLNAAYLGRYYLPVAYCEAMYDNRITASVAGKWIDVVK